MGSHREHLDRLTPFAAHVSFGLNEVDDTYRRVSGMQEIDRNDPLYRIISQIEFMVRNDIEYESEHDSKCARTAGLTEISDNMAAAGSTEGSATKRLRSQSAEQSPAIDRAAPRATSRPRDPARVNEGARPSAAAIEAIDRFLDRINSDAVQGLIHRAEANTNRRKAQGLCALTLGCVVPGDETAVFIAVIVIAIVKKHEILLCVVGPKLAQQHTVLPN